MCGICGVFHLDGEPASGAAIDAMTRRLIHRGPDSGGAILDGAVGLGNRRLAILDPSTAAALPMESADGRYALAYNGEIYNHLELRSRLAAHGVTFRTTSDAETLIEVMRAARTAGEGLLALEGMFAFALWDRQTETLTLARDRVGEKPLYIYNDGRFFAFASEIKALLAHPRVVRASSLVGGDSPWLAVYLGFGYLPAPLTAFQHIVMLPPGRLATVRVNARDGWRYEIEIAPYWEAGRPVSEADAAPIAVAEAKARVRDALDTAVKRTLLSDVPLGAFLSGGLDSSVIVALMRQHSNAAVKTFSIGFSGDASFDETPYAQRAADALGTTHTAFTVEPEAIGLLDKLVWHHDQPFADSSAIPTYLVSRLAREQVTVALTGDGGDEAFGGYERFYAAAMIDRLRAVPRPLWRATAGVIGRLPEGTGYYNLLKRARRFAQSAAQPPALAYFDLIRVFSAADVVALTGQSDAAGTRFAGMFESAPGLNDLLWANLTTYLPDDLLIKTDRSSMAASLEARAPFLTAPVLEAAWALPPSLKLRGRTTKYILREVARDLIPADLIDRPKHGFGVPLGAWLRRDLGVVRELLLSGEARGRGLLHLPAVERLIADHADGRRDHGGRLWALLTLESWHRQFIDAAAIPENVS
ncbi:MAG: asparagine synthase (glutamine-hydrolyzing) [Chloroflexota bacterium]|nr:asparagine synthase (glutamine-hydrolyzing) [Chloroflexota bacterium]